MTNKQDELAENFREVPPPPDVVTYVSRIANRVKSQKDPKLTHYTPTYLSWCARLQFYILMMYPKEKLESDDEFSSGWNLFRGDALHHALARIYKWNELPLKAQFPIGDGKSVTISGRLDCYQQDEAEILDLKSTKYLSWQKKSNFLPRRKDVNQVRIYQLLYRDIMPVKKLTLLYADMAELTTYDIPILKETETWLRNRIIEIENAMQSQIPPTADGKTENAALCSYCAYQTRCHDDPGGITGKPKSHPVEDLK
jgi:CRISPR/Cas system-associated exonuclease Cas4 (RecB family)